PVHADFVCCKLIYGKRAQRQLAHSLYPRQVKRTAQGKQSPELDRTRTQTRPLPPRDSKSNLILQCVCHQQSGIYKPSQAIDTSRTYPFCEQASAINKQGNVIVKI